MLKDNFLWYFTESVKHTISYIYEDLERIKTYLLSLDHVDICKMGHSS